MDESGSPNGEMATVAQPRRESEEDRVRRALEATDFPPWVTGREFRFVEDYYGEPALYVYVDVERDAPREEWSTRILRAVSELQGALLDEGVERFPYIKRGPAPAGRAGW